MATIADAIGSEAMSFGTADRYEPASTIVAGPSP